MGDAGHPSWGRTRFMPSLFRFLSITGTLVAVICGTLYFFATQFEPEQREVVKVVPGVKVRSP